MSILLAAFGAIGQGLDAASLTAWSDINLTWPTAFGTNEDRTITWSVGGARTISTNYGGAGDFKYRINSGSWTAYTTPFSLSSGQTLGWQYTSPGVDEFVSVTVTDDTKSATLSSFNVSISDNP